MAYDYEAEIERLIKLGFGDLYCEWDRSTGFRCYGIGSRIFSTCGTRAYCGCPTMIRSEDRWPAQTRELTDAIDAMTDIPGDFADLRPAWESADAAGRRKLLEPFARAQRLTDEVLEKEAANG